MGANYEYAKARDASQNGTVAPPRADRIPRSFHRIWLGSKPIPDAFEGYWRAWRRRHPGAALRTWRDADIDAFRAPWPDVVSVLEADGNVGHRSDVLRLLIIAAEGGVYVDTDLEPQRAINRFLTLSPAFMGCSVLASGMEADTENALLAAVPSHPFFLYCLARLPEWYELQKKRGADVITKTGPRFLRAMLRDWCQRPEGFSHGVTVYPPALFFPQGWSERGQDWRHSSAYTRHHWTGLWLKP